MNRREALAAIAAATALPEELVPVPMIRVSDIVNVKPGPITFPAPTANWGEVVSLWNGPPSVWNCRCIPLTIDIE